MVASNVKRKLHPSYPRVYLTKERNKLNLSVYDVADIIGISPYYYYKIENGRRGQNLGVKLFYEICKCFNVDANTLIEKEIRYQKERDIFLKHKKARKQVEHGK